MVNPQGEGKSLESQILSNMGPLGLLALKKLKNSPIGNSKYIFFHFIFTQLYECGIIIHTVKMRRMRSEEVKYLAQRHTARR